MNLQAISKSIAGALAAGVTGVGATAIMVPDNSPWYAYVAVGIANAAIGFATVYFAPKNIPNK